MERKSRKVDHTVHSSRVVLTADCACGHSHVARRVAGSARGHTSHTSHTSHTRLTSNCTRRLASNCTRRHTARSLRAMAAASSKPHWGLARITCDGSRAQSGSHSSETQWLARIALARCPGRRRSALQNVRCVVPSHRGGARTAAACAAPARTAAIRTAAATHGGDGSSGSQRRRSCSCCVLTAHLAEAHSAPRPVAACPAAALHPAAAHTTAARLSSFKPTRSVDIWRSDPLLEKRIHYLE